MIVLHQRKRVDVAERNCPSLKCFWLGEDKGTYTPGRGYTSYHAKPRLVCMTRHCHGCPVVGVCAACRTCIAPYADGKCVNSSCEFYGKSDKIEMDKPSDGKAR